jgi:hypothetical protein
LAEWRAFDQKVSAVVIADFEDFRGSLDASLITFTQS